MEYLRCRAYFYYFSQIHHGDPVTHIIYRAQSVSHKKAGEMQLLLQLAQQIQNLGLNGHIQRADGFITDKESGIQRQRLGNPDPLSLSPGKFMGIPSQHIPGKPHHIQNSIHILRHGGRRGYVMIQHGLGQDFINMLP